MFETEAGFAETKMLINCHGDYSKKQDYKKGWQDGATFGYNKAKEEMQELLKEGVQLLKNSDEYWRRMTSFKLSMNIIRREIVYLSGIEKLAEVKPEPEQEREQHWLWCFYQETIDKVNKRTLAKLTEMADARAGYHFDLDAVPKKEA